MRKAGGFLLIVCFALVCGMSACGGTTCTDACLMAEICNWSPSSYGATCLNLCEVVSNCITRCDITETCTQWRECVLAECYAG